jgi:hypothetical protein
MRGFVIARSDSDEAIHISAWGAMDCFASFAMTSLAGWVTINHLVETEIASR